VSFLRALGRYLGDWVYGILITFGWQPKEERSDSEKQPR
jgi:hypothetical protein